MGDDTLRSTGADDRAKGPADPFADVAAFLRLVGHHSLFDYFGLDRQDEGHRARDAIESRRRWAQAQQSNPKFQDEARWLLRNHNLVLQVLVERRDDYLRQLESRRTRRSVEQFDLFVQGSLASGVDSVELERAAEVQARALGLAPELAQEHLAQARANLRPAGEGGPRRGGLSQSLLAVMHDCVARGDLTAADVRRVLEEGRKRQMSDHALQRVLEVAAARAARRRQQGEDGPGSLSGAMESGVRSRETNPLDAQLRGDAIREIVDTIRGALLMGILSPSTLANVQKRGVQLGLDQRSVELVVAEARRACEQAMNGQLNPYGVLGVQPDIDQDGLRQAYQSGRRWALGLADPAEGHRGCVLVDVAWSLVRDARARARYDQSAAARASG